MDSIEPTIDQMWEEYRGQHDMFSNLIWAIHETDDFLNQQRIPAAEQVWEEFEAKQFKAKKRLDYYFTRALPDDIQEFLDSPASSIFLENLLNAGISPVINHAASEDEEMRSSNGNGSYKNGFHHDGVRQQKKINDRRTPKRNDHEFSVGFKPRLSYGSQQNTRSLTFSDFYASHEDPEEAHAAFLCYQADMQEREAIKERYRNLADSFAERFVRDDIQHFDAYQQKKREREAAIARLLSPREREGNGAEHHAGTAQQGSNGIDGNGTLYDAVEAAQKPRYVNKQHNGSHPRPLSGPMHNRHHGGLKQSAFPIPVQVHIDYHPIFGGRLAN